MGETPYSEMMGDKESLQLDKKDLKAIENVRKAGVPVKTYGFRMDFVSEIVHQNKHSESIISY